MLFVLKKNTGMGFCLALIASSLIFNLSFSQGSKPVNRAEIGEQMIIRGKISVKGNEPFTYLCLTTEIGTEYRISGQYLELIWRKHQMQMVELKGEIVKKAIGPGFPARFNASEILSVKSP